MSEFTIKRDTKLCHVTLADDLTAVQIPALRTALKAELDGGVREVIFDMNQTVMLDSSGIGLLIATFNTLNRQQGRLRVVNASPDIVQLLQTMRLVNRLNVTGRANN